jgi:hypothetical protein
MVHPWRNHGAPACSWAVLGLSNTNIGTSTRAMITLASAVPSACLRALRVTALGRVCMLQQSTRIDV